ncbi:MAG TPA: biotin/lipoyl-containing protein [Vicinamibacteria bacterium]|nr:biotin/lipoyl-containing protein [Vicinamibacteria bacterium]
MRFDAEIGGRTLRLSVGARDGGYAVDLDGRQLHVEAVFEGPFLSLCIDGQRHELGMVRRGDAFAVTSPTGVLEVQLCEAARYSDLGARRSPAGPARVSAPMPGKVVRVLVGAGQAVEAGDGLVVVEAMKMENELRAPRAGVVLDLPAREGQPVESGALLAVVG